MAAGLAPFSGLSTFDVAAFAGSNAATTFHPGRSLSSGCHPVVGVLLAPSLGRLIRTTPDGQSLVQC